MRSNNILIFVFLMIPLLLGAQANEWGENGKVDKKEDAAKSFFMDRWDITVDVDGEPHPSWLEITKSGYSTLVGRFVGISGSSRPISEVVYHKGTISFSIPPQWYTEPHNLVVFAHREGDELVGTMKFPDGKEYNWRGKRAPLLIREGKLEWGDPIVLFGGKNMDAWETRGQKNQWIVEKGIMKSPHSGANLFTKDEFEDFKIHAEVRYPKGSNSGIYLRGRHEVQIVDSSGAKAPSDIILGAVYGFLTPSELADKPAGEWQTLDITLLGRKVTVELNGTTIINNQIIPGITGGAIDSDEAAPGPIYLQGDHGPVEYRNIILTPAKWK